MRMKSISVVVYLVAIILGTSQEKLTKFHVKNNGQEQLLHQHSLITPLVICFLRSIQAKLDACKFSTFWIASIDKQTCWSLTLSETPKQVSSQRH